VACFDYWRFNHRTTGPARRDATLIHAGGLDQLASSSIPFVWRKRASWRAAFRRWRAGWRSADRRPL